MLAVAARCRGKKITLRLGNLRGTLPLLARRTGPNAQGVVTMTVVWLHSLESQVEAAER